MLYLGYNHAIENMKNFSFNERLQSFRYAFKGMILLFKKEHNAWIHGIAMLSVIAMGFYFSISNSEWIAVILCIGIVLAAEAFNTAIEIICDYIQPDHDKRIEYIKDLAAGGVLFTAISAFCVGLIIFLPKFLQLISG